MASLAASQRLLTASDCLLGIIVPLSQVFGNADRRRRKRDRSGL